MSVRCIHAEAFSRCENLKKAIIPSSVSVIAEDAFAHCYYLNSTEANQSSDQLSVKLADMKTELSAKFANREHISPKTTTNLTTEEAVVEAEKSKNSADTSICNITPRPDAFTQFANIFTSSIEELSLSDAAYKDGAIFDKEKKSVSITVPISQYTHDEALLNEYIACAETIQPGNSLRVQVGRYRWDLYSQSGKALGYVSTDFWDITNYLNILTIQNCTVAEVTPKSARRKNAKYALVSVTLEISERTPAESLTQEDAEARKLFAYYVDQTGVQLVHWLGRSLEKKITIPATIEGHPVTTICSDVFRLPTCNLCVGEIVFPEGIKRLSASVLYQLENLKKIVFPASLEYISPNIFASSTGDNKDLYLSAKTIYVAPQDSYADKFLKAYTPDSFDVSILTVVNDTLESKPIDTKLLSTLRIERADQELLVGFKSEWEIADAPQNIDIPETISGEKVKIFSLYGIPNTTEVLTIPSTVIDLRDMTESTLFYGSGKNLHTIGIAADNEHYWSDGFSIFSKDRKTLLRFMSFTSTAYSVPDGTEIIGKNAFNSMENLRTIALPNSISKIDDFAFSGCSQLEIISNIEAVTEIGKQILGLNVPYVQKKSVLQIGSSLLKYENTNEKIIKIPEGITKICAYALSGERGDVAEEIVLPSSLLVIEENAFYGRKQLEKINIPEGVQAIPRGAFCGCEKLKTISIPASVSEINTDAFPIGYSFGAQSCSFASINVDCKNQHYCSIDGMLLSKDCTKLLFVPNCIQSTTLRIPDGVEIICENAAYGNSNLTKVIMPNSVTTVDEGAFMHCENLTCVTISSNVERINSHAFEDTAITEIPLPENLRHIGTQAFSNTQAKRVMLPKSVRTLGWGAFSGVNEIEVYDSIDPEAKMAHEGIDDCNGYPNSLVGYIGIGPAWAMWECAANHRWNDYTITVRANDTNEIKYKVWMGADESQRDYYCFLASAWGRNATFAFEQLDCYFPKIRNKYHKRMVAQYRLEYPYELSEASRKRYETFLDEIKKGGWK